MYRNLIFTGVLVIGLAFVGFMVFSLFQDTGNDKQEVVSGNELENMTVEELIEYAENKPKKEIKGSIPPNPFGDLIPEDSLSENLAIRYMHQMSHQKVQAEYKEFFFEMTEERIDWLVQAVSSSGVVLSKNHKPILERWDNNDFSRIDLDHNLLYQQASAEPTESGKATGILSKEEEKEYIENKTPLDEVRGY